MLTWQGFKAWLGEFFTPGQIVGMRGSTAGCPIACYLLSQGGTNPSVEGSTTAVTLSDGTRLYMADQQWLQRNPSLLDENRHMKVQDPRIRRFVERIDASGASKARVQARTALKVIREIEQEFPDEQVAQFEWKAEASPELVGPAPAVKAESEGQAVLS